MTRLTGAVVAGAALFVPAVPTAAIAYEVFGSGTISCGQWLQDRQTTDPDKILKAQDEGWVLGLITGMNAAKSSNRKSDAAGMFAWIDNYCRAHPLDELVAAAEELWFALNKPAPK